MKLDVYDIIELITLFRNRKVENNISNEFEVISNVNSSLLNQMLKIEDKIVEKSSYNGKVVVSYKNYELVIYYDNSSNQLLELEKLMKEKDELEKSIMRREKLLANENYVAKAPKEIVASEQEKLAIEKERLDVVVNSLLTKKQ